MSITPIFDAALADAPVNIWQASTIFPQPNIITERALCAAEPTYAYVWPQTHPANTTFTDWNAVKLGGDA